MENQNNRGVFDLKFRTMVGAALVSAVIAVPASGATIIGAVSAVASSEFPGNGIDKTIDQSGLSAGYTSGVTDFDVYLAGNPSHSFIAAGNEWFTNQGVSEAQVTYDLGGLFTLDRLALWHEDAAGFTSAAISTSTDGVAFTAATVINPVDSLINNDYFAQVFGLGGSLGAQFVRLDLRGCPGGQDASFDGCAIGEIAFSSVEGQVPLPAALPLMAASLGVFGFMGWRRKRAA